MKRQIQMKSWKLDYQHRAAAAAAAREEAVINKRRLLIKHTRTFACGENTRETEL